VNEDKALILFIGIFHLVWGFFAVCWWFMYGPWHAVVSYPIFYFGIGLALCLPCSENLNRRTWWRLVVGWLVGMLSDDIRNWIIDYDYWSDVSEPPSGCVSITKERKVKWWTMLRFWSVSSMKE